MDTAARLLFQGRIKNLFVLSIANQGNVTDKSLQQGKAAFVLAGVSDKSPLTLIKAAPSGYQH